MQASAGAGLAASARGGRVAQTGGTAALKMRWYGGGVYELATLDDRAILLIDAWIWSNTGFTAFNSDKPAELGSAQAYAAHIKSRRPDAFIVALTHDHTDHMGDYFDLLPALLAAGVDVKSVGQSDLMRAALVPKFKAANLDNTTLVLNNGNGINLGGTVTYKEIGLTLVPAVHSTFAGVPAVGFIVDMGGARIYASGDTDLYGDIRLIGTRYRPDLAILSAGNGFATMGPEDAAQACTFLNVAHAVPVHYGHNPLVLGPQCADRFRTAVARVSPGTAVTVLRPGETAALHLTTKPRTA
jgi:L-ascorbate metabolism protein UlaG (beta-lactamase superfamily)